jgi:hypothetical protein
MYMPPYTEKGIMEGFSFAAWLKAVGLTKMEAAKALGISPVYASMLSARPYAGLFSCNRGKTPGKRKLLIQ